MPAKKKGGRPKKSMTAKVAANIKKRTGVTDAKAQKAAQQFMKKRKNK